MSASISSVCGAVSSMPFIPNAKKCAHETCEPYTTAEKAALEALKKLAEFSKIYEQMDKIINDFEKEHEEALKTAIILEVTNSGKPNEELLKTDSEKEELEQSKMKVVNLRNQLRQFFDGDYPNEDEIFQHFRVLFGSSANGVLQHNDDAEPTPTQINRAKVLEFNKFDSNDVAFCNDETIWIDAKCLFRAPPKTSTALVRPSCVRLFEHVEPDSIIEKSVTLIFGIQEGFEGIPGMMKIKDTSKIWHDQYELDFTPLLHENDRWEYNWSSVVDEDKDYTWLTINVEIFERILTQITEIKAHKVVKTVLTELNALLPVLIPYVSAYLIDTFYVKATTLSPFNFEFIDVNTFEVNYRDQDDPYRKDLVEF